MIVLPVVYSLVIGIVSPSVLAIRKSSEKIRGSPDIAKSDGNTELSLGFLPEIEYLNIRLKINTLVMVNKRERCIEKLSLFDVVIQGSKGIEVDLRDFESRIEADLMAFAPCVVKIGIQTPVPADSKKQAVRRRTPVRTQPEA